MRTDRREEKVAVSRRHGSEFAARRDRSVRRAQQLTLVAVLLVAGASCRQDMHDQPKYIPLRPVEQLGSITDGRSARPMVEGTVPRGGLREDAEFYTGKVAGFAENRAASPTSSATDAFQGFVKTFPMQIGAADLDRGQQGFEVYCGLCHGPLGYGDGMIVRRGFRKPPSYHEDRLRTAPVGYFYDVITNGFGTMPDYAAQIEPADRWRIIAYIRALQLSQNAALADVPADKRDQLNKKPEAAEGAGTGGHR